ncbi:hypothetical protein KIH86_20990 [Paenibacillus sp. HN-1]|uniref:hypothetical protein n=1 Tax=Paenibacillus TaxID=44249 RepID=UPI001CA8ACAE|nr:MULTISPECIES: hypothetical protein [Paenibacillus]MBY9079986.1 hypothetical protein [Paenibacillus sp. CGMCC 1.18879]MBY9086684.1 hypothetical protein [Paenibacillus sinensis]
MHRSQREDHMLVKSCVMLPLILSAFERDAKLISAHLRTPAPYLDVLQTAARFATCDLRDVRSEMRRRGVKIYEQQRRPDGIEAKYVCRGFHETMLLLNDMIAAQAAIHMRKYLGLDISSYQSYEDQYQLGIQQPH